jgi:hypothetical protein
MEREEDRLVRCEQLDELRLGRAVRVMFDRALDVFGMTQGGVRK